MLLVRQGLFFSSDFLFKFFSLCLVFFSLHMICLALDFLGLILFYILWMSWICDSVSVINLGIFLVIIASNISSFPVFSFWYSHYLHVTPFGDTSLFHLSFLCISDFGVSIHFFLAHRFIFCVYLLMGPSEALFISVSFFLFLFLIISSMFF